MNAGTDVFEDRPLPDGVEMTDWTGTAWKELTPERVEYLIRQPTKKGKIVTFLSEIPVGEGRKREGLPSFKAANSLRNALYRAAQKAWGTKTSGAKAFSGKRVNSHIKVAITHDKETDTYQVEFVHLAPEKEDPFQTKIRRQVHTEEELKDELYMLCLRYQTPTVTGPSIYNALKRGEINTVEDLRAASLDDIAEIRNIGPEKLEVIAQIKDKA